MTRKRRGCEPFSLSHAAVVSPEGRSSEVAGRRKARRDNSARIKLQIFDFLEILGIKSQTDFRDIVSVATLKPAYYTQTQHAVGCKMGARWVQDKFA